MIIVSQDKKKAINSNAIQIINIYQNQLWAGNMSNNQLGDFDTVLGTYKTEERAKEVLKEIVDTYVMIGIDIETYEGTRRQLPIYKMPEE